MWDSDLLKKWTRVFLYKCKVFRRGRPVNKLIGSTFTLERRCHSVKVATQQLFWVTNVPCSRKSNRLELLINQHCIYWKQQTSKHVFCKVLYNNDEYVMEFNVSNMSKIYIKKCMVSEAFSVSPSSYCQNDLCHTTIIQINCTTLYKWESILMLKFIMCL